MRTPAVIVAATMLLSVCQAATYIVNPDGSGDFPTIQSAIDGVVSGDVIALADGVFTGNGNRDLDYRGKAITIRSLSGFAESCVIDCGTYGHRGFDFHSGEGADARLDAVTIRNGHVQGSYPAGCGAGILCRNSSPTLTGCIFADCRASAGGGLHCSHQGEPTLNDCVFIDNEATDTSGGMYCGGGLTPTLTRCTFAGNSAALFGGGFYCTENTSPVLTECVFIANACEMSGAGVRCSSGTSTLLVRCTFDGNQAGQGGGAISCYMAVECILRNCTLYGNSALSSGNGISVQNTASVIVENTIIAFGTAGEAVACTSPLPIEMVCCDVFGNVGGDWTECIVDHLGSNGNICADPLFCDPAAGDLSLDCESPCAPFSPQHPECDLTGAWPIGCGASPTNRTTWGRLRVTFAR